MTEHEAWKEILRRLKKDEDLEGLCYGISDLCWGKEITPAIESRMRSKIRKEYDSHTKHKSRPYEDGYQYLWPAQSQGRLRFTHRMIRETAPKRKKQ